MSLGMILLLITGGILIYSLCTGNFYLAFVISILLVLNLIITMIFSFLDVNLVDLANYLHMVFIELKPIFIVLLVQICLGIAVVYFLKKKVNTKT